MKIKRSNIIFIWLVSFTVSFSIELKHISSFEDLIVDLGAALVSSTIGTVLFILMFEKIYFYVLEVMKSKK